MVEKNEYEAVIVLGGRIVENMDGTWHTSNFDDIFDNFGVVGDRARVEAASIIYKEKPEIVIVVSGGKGQLQHLKKVPNLSEIIKKELIELGVSKKVIIEENQSNNTYSQILLSGKKLRNNDISSAIIVSNKYHLPRIKAFLDTDSELREIFSSIDVTLISAEEILVKKDEKKWNAIIKKAYQTESMRKRIMMEKKGVEDIKMKVYKK